MTNAVNRRSFLKTSSAVGAGLGLMGLGVPGLAADPIAKGVPSAAKLGWRVSCCAYTFNQCTLYEAIEKIAALGLHDVEGFAWQGLSPANRNVKTNESLSDDLRKEMKKRLDDAGVKMVSCYLSGLPNKEDVCRKTFEFGKQMGMETFVAEPPPEAFDMLEKLCDKYKINLAIHNHPKPSSRYWNPDTVVAACRGRSKRIGCCADTGHWVRSGLQPVECLKKLEGRLIEFHLKDIVEFGVVRSADCPWGTGKGDIEGILKEVLRQKAKVVFGIEYERHGDTMPDLVQSLAYFEKVAAALGG